MPRWVLLLCRNFVRYGIRKTGPMPRFRALSYIKSSFEGSFIVRAVVDFMASPEASSVPFSRRIITLLRPHLAGRATVSVSR